MGGGPSTPALAVAVSEAGGLGFLAAGYRAPDAVRSEVEELRALTARPFGVNLFAPPGAPGDPAALARYGAELAGEAGRHGVAVGEPRHDDDHWDAKLALAAELRVPVVSFTFGCPDAAAVRALQAAGCAVWVTVTTAAEARAATAAGADALVVQGAEAGGHRGSFDDAAPGDIGLLALLQLVQAVSDLPLVATGGIATGRGVAAVLAGGAAAAQLGSAFMLAPEAATAPSHREALAGPAADRAHPRLHRPHRARHRQPLPGRARRPERVPRGPPHDRAGASRRPCRGRRRRLQPLGRPGARARPPARRRRARPHARRRGPRRT